MKTQQEAIRKRTRAPVRRAGPLSRLEIRRAALEIVDAVGLAELTVRRLAQSLRVTPMAIYRYFPNKAALEATLVDLVVSDSAVTAHDESELRLWLLQTFARMRHALCRHPGIMPLLGTASHSSGNALAIVEQVLGRMRSHGIHSDDATRLFYRATAFTLGSVIMMDDASLARFIEPRQVQDELQRQRRGGFAVLPKAEFPHVVAASAALAECYGGRRFEQELLGLIDDILPRTLRARAPVDRNARLRRR